MGTPTIFAMVKPINMSDTACAAFPFSAMRLATTDPTPKNAPWGKPESNLAINKVLKVGANAEKALNTVNITIKAIRIIFGGYLPAIIINKGAPITTPKA